MKFTSVLTVLACSALSLAQQIDIVSYGLDSAANKLSVTASVNGTYPPSLGFATRFFNAFAAASRKHAHQYAITVAVTNDDPVQDHLLGLFGLLNADEDGSWVYNNKTANFEITLTVPISADDQSFYKNLVLANWIQYVVRINSTFTLI